MRRVLLVGGILAAVCMVICVVVSVIAVFMAEQERQEFIDTYGETVASMCNPPAGGESSADNLPTGTTPFKAIVLENDSDGQRHSWHDDLASDLRAENADELAIVICVGDEESTQVEVCPYTATGAEGEATVFNVERNQFSVDVVLLNAETGNRIDEITIDGAMPGECPDEYRAVEGTTPEINGDRPTYNDFLIAVEDILRGQN